LHAQLGEAAAERQHLDHAIELFTKLGAAPDLTRAVDLQHRPEPERDDTIPPVAAASLVPPGDHKASDVLLMQRLLDASASRELLLQELVSIVEENLEPGRVLLLEQQGTTDATVTLARGCDAEASEALAREINWAIASDGRMASGAVFKLDDRTDDKVLLYIERVPPADRLRPLLRQVELGLETCALRESSRRSAESDVSRPRVETVIPGFILAGAAMREVIERIHKIRTSDVTVLITGESGTGKELVARAIHAGSERRRAVFLPFNCTATPKEIIDSQLFGHRRGSFTGATSNYPGIIRAAEGGTLFLDEIGDLALEVQPKLLRFLESGEIQPLGEAKPAKVDVRVVAATNSDLERAVEEGRFREDLFHRLNIIRIVVPPLRERREEIPVLADHFLKHFAERLGKSILTLTPDAMVSLTSYFWPGNVRQLRNEMERVAAYAVADSKVAATDLSPELTASGGGRRYERNSDRDARYVGRTDQDRGSRNLKEATAMFERNLIETALERSGYSLSRAARELGVSRRGLHVKMAQLGISRSSDFA
ncbi:MAG: sigma-54 dependent transcriptional regulator, partial [Blastocatellia bacterium]